MAQKEKKLKKRKSHRLYALFVILFGIAILVLSVMLLFKIQRIQVKGNDYCSDTEIVDMVQSDVYSSNSLFVIGKYMIGQGKILPCLENVRVSMKAPWELKITVKEKEIVGYVKKEKEYFYFDREGLIVEQSTEKTEGIPVVTGIDLEDAKLYETLKSGNSEMFEEILEASKELKKYDLTTKKIQYRNDYIYLYIKKVCVNLGNSVTAEKIAQIPPIMEQLGNKKGTLHLENYSEGRETITFNKNEYPKEK